MKIEIKNLTFKIETDTASPDYGWVLGCDNEGTWVRYCKLEHLLNYGVISTQETMEDRDGFDYMTFESHANKLFEEFPYPESYRLAKAYCAGARRHHWGYKHKLDMAKIDTEELRTKLSGNMLKLHNRIRLLEQTLRSCASNAGDVNLVGALVDDALNNDKEWMVSKNDNEIDSGSEPIT